MLLKYNSSFIEKNILEFIRALYFFLLNVLDITNRFSNTAKLNCILVIKIVRVTVTVPVNNKSVSKWMEEKP